MTYGFQVFNNNGLLQIDENFKTYRVVLTGTFSTFANQIPVALDEIVLIQPLVSGMGLAFDVGGNGPDGLYAEPVNTYQGGPYYFKYVKIAPAVMQAEPFGLAVFNSIGDIVFDSRASAGVFSGMYSFPFQTSETYTGPKLVKQLVLPPVPQGKDRYFTMSGALYAVFADVTTKTIINIYAPTFNGAAVGSLFTLLVMDIYV